MANNMLRKSFHQLSISVKGAIATRYCSTQASNAARNCAAIFCKPQEDADSTFYEPNLRPMFARSPILDLNLPHRPVPLGKIYEFPINTNRIIGEPPMISRIHEDRTITDKSMDLPSNETTEKHAVTMIVIRRRKMRRHKLRKFRKRTKFEYRRKRLNREIAKEKAFHAELLEQIKQAEKFNAKEYVQSRLEVLDKVRLPTTYQGFVLPESQMREFLKRDEERRERKRNKPRLTL